MSVVPFVRKLKNPQVPNDDVYFEMPSDTIKQVMLLGDVFIANADLLDIDGNPEYFKGIAMHTSNIFPGRMLVDVNLPNLRGCFSVNPVTKRLEKLLERPLAHFG